MKYNNQSELMHELQMLNFALTDLNLYLDTHPTCKEGLECFRKFQELWEEAVREYTRNYGPITSNSAKVEDCWTWNEGPHPWQYEWMNGGQCACGRM